MNYNDICNAPNHAGIYCFKNKINGKCYIGQAIKIRSRLKCHWNAINSHSIDNMIIYKAIDKYGVENFELKIIYEIRNSLAWDTKKKLDELEKKYIQEYNSYENGYNQTLGGDAGVLGYKMTDEQKERIRQNSIQQQQRIRDEKSKDKNNWVKCKNLITNEILVFKSVKEASDSLNIPMPSLKNGLRKINHIIKKCWQFCYYSEEFEVIPARKSTRTKTWSCGQYRELENKKEICEYIKAHPNCSFKEISNSFKLCKRTFYNYLQELNIVRKNRGPLPKVSKEDFVEYYNSHTKQECIEHFGITEDLFYRYRKRYIYGKDKINEAIGKRNVSK